jgi:hypothetical protein
VIDAFLRLDGTEDVDVAIQCLVNKFENIESGPGMPFYEDLPEAWMVGEVIRQLASSCLRLESRSLHCRLARHIYSISQSPPIADPAITGLTAPIIIQHLEHIDWSDSLPELWHFVHELPNGVSLLIDGFGSSIFACLLETLPVIGFRAQSLVLGSL